MCGQDFAVFVDAADSPDALRACLRAARQVTSGRVICVFGRRWRTAKSSDWPAMGRVVGAMADVAVVTTIAHRGDDARIASACKCVADLPIGERPELSWIAMAGHRAGHCSEAEPGDTVVIAGMGERSARAIGIATGMLIDDCERLRRKQLARNACTTSGTATIGCLTVIYAIGGSRHSSTHTDLSATTPVPNSIGNR